MDRDCEGSHGTIWPLSIHGLQCRVDQLKQTGNISKHKAASETLSNMVHGWPKEALVGAFIGGLRRRQD